MTFTPEFLLQIIVAAGAGFGSYAAIRADLARLHERTTAAQDKAKDAKDSAARAHVRLDELTARNR